MFSLDQSSMRLVLIALLLWICLTTLNAHADDPVSNMEATFGGLTQIDWTAQEKTQTLRKPDSVQVSRAAWIKAARDGTRWASLTTETGDSYINGKVLPYSWGQEIIMGGEQGILINFGESFVNTRFDDPKLIPTSNIKLDLAGSIDASSPQPGLSAIDFMRVGRTVFGFVDGYQTFADVLAGGETIPEDSKLKLPGSIVISNSSKFGKYRAWLDPQFGFLPRRLEGRKDGTDLLSNMQIAKLPLNKAGKIWPTTQLKEYRQVIDNVEIAILAGHPFLRSFVDTKSYMYSDGQELTIRTDFEIAEFGLPTGKSFVPIVIIPDNTRVAVEQSPNIQYIWHDGRIVPNPNPRTAEKLENLKFQSGGGGGFWRPFFIIVNVVVVLACIGLIIWRLRSRRPR